MSNETKEKKKNPLFEILNVIQTKEYDWAHLPDELKSKYSQFMINRFISSYEYLLPLVNEITTKRLTNEQHFTLLYNWVKKTKHYFNYKSYATEKEDEDLIIALKKEYSIGSREAKRYNECLTNEQREYLKKKWADYIKYMAKK